MKQSARAWMTGVTLVLLAIVIYFAWPDILRAFSLAEKIDGWILLLLIPVQLLSYYAAGSMIFSYLRAKGDLHHMSHWSLTRLSLEFNFVNHVLPSGGAAGFSYMAWVLGRHKVSASRATMAQLVRLLLMFSSFVTLMLISVLILAITGRVDRAVGVVALILTVGLVALVLLLGWLIHSKARLTRFSETLVRRVNAVIAWVTRQKVTAALKSEPILDFFMGLHDDYLSIRRERKILLVPYIWGLVANTFDVLLIWIAFWSLGAVVDPTMLFIAFGLASIGGAIAVTPGGAGVYEAIMIAFLTTGGVTADVAIAGTLLARVILLTGTIFFGYIFYQLTVLRYGKRPAER